MSSPQPGTHELHSTMSLSARIKNATWEELNETVSLTSHNNPLAYIFKSYSKR
jgi:hypothetical protein